MLRYPGLWWRSLLPVLLPNLGGPCPHILGTLKRVGHGPPTDRFERLSYGPSGGLYSYPCPVPTQLAADLPAKATGRATSRRQVRIRTRAIRQVVVVEVAGSLSEVVEELDRAIQLALADGPRGVVCDLSNVLEGTGPGGGGGARNGGAPCS